MNKKNLYNALTSVLEKMEKEERRIGTENVRFFDMKVQKQYDEIKACQSVFDALTDKEFKEVKERIQRAKNAQKTQINLF